MKYLTRTSLCFAVVAALLAGCSSTTQSPQARGDLNRDAQDAMAAMKAKDPTLQGVMDESIAYAVFPNVGKGGAIVGGAHGDGVLYENGRLVGYCQLTQGTVGAQLGGQVYSQWIFFNSRQALDDFKNEKLEFSAQASAVAVKYGAAMNAPFRDGVAVFTLDQAGLMAEASIGGQKFNYTPASGDAIASSRIDPGSTDVARPDNRDNDFNVYGYARDDESAAAWRHDSDYNRLWDPNSTQTIRGEVIAVNEFSPRRDGLRGRQVTLRAEDGQEYIVHLGPTGYIEKQSNTLRIREGDQLTVTGSKVKFENKDVIMASEVRGTAGDSLMLRNQQGQARWNDR